MSIQHQRLVELCNELRLGGIAVQNTALVQKAAEKQISFTDFVEEPLVDERESRRARAREMFARIAGFPAIKTLVRLRVRYRRTPQADPGTSEARLCRARGERGVPRPSGVGKTHLAIALGYLATPEGVQNAFSAGPIWC